MLYNFYELRIKNEPDPYLKANKKRTIFKLPEYDTSIFSQFLMDKYELEKKKPFEVIKEMFRKTYFPHCEQACSFAETAYDEGVSKALASIFEYIYAFRNASIKEALFICGRAFVLYAGNFSRKSLAETSNAKKIEQSLGELYCLIDGECELHQAKYLSESSELLKLKSELSALHRKAKENPHEFSLSSIYTVVLDNWDTWSE